jgi:hypothetical protein
LGGFDSVAFFAAGTAICGKSRFCLLDRRVFAGFTVALLAIPEQCHNPPERLFTFHADSLPSFD